MKVFRLANAEFGKLLARPALYIMTAFLVLALVITAFTFNPPTKSSTQTNFGTPTGSVSEAFAIFNANSTNADTKNQLDSGLLAAYTDIKNFANADSEYTKLLTSIEELNALMTSNQSGSSLPEILFAFTNSPTTQNRSALDNILEATNESIRNQALKIYNNCKIMTNSTNIDFYAKSSQINKIEDYLLNLATSIPVNIETLTNEQVVETAENLRANFDLSGTISQIKDFEKIDLSDEKIAEITANYYDVIKFETGSSTLLTQLYDEIENFAFLNSTSTESKDKAELNKLITKYKNASQICENLLIDSFSLAKAGDMSNAKLNNYIGFENYNLYELRESITLGNYLLENKIFDGEHFTNFNFNALSGNQATAYDFTIYAVQILGIIITIFCLFFAVSITSGEFQNGTIKMVATRPFTRSKLISGKMFACINFMFLFLIFGTIASFVVGVSMFGIGLNTHYLVFNASTVIAIPDFAVLLLYLASVALNIIFYISIAFLLSMLLRSSTFALFATFVLYFFGLLFNAIATGAGWFLWTPFAHLDLFKYFGNASASNGFLAMNIPIGASFALSAIILALSLIIIQTITKIIFKRRDIA